MLANIHSFTGVGVAISVGVAIGVEMAIGVIFICNKYNGINGISS